MNIFYVDENPVLAAKALVDKHIIKMPLETAQLLSTAHRVLDGCEYMGGNKDKAVKRYLLDSALETYLYHATHVNHPSSKWVRQSVANYEWLYNHFLALNLEFNVRRNKFHKAYELLIATRVLPKNLPEGPFTPPPCCMPKEYIISDNAVENYRNYYLKGKAHLHKWTKRSPPTWYSQSGINNETS